MYSRQSMPRPFHLLQTVAGLRYRVRLLFYVFAKCRVNGMLIHFIHGYYCIYRPWQPLTYLYFPYHCISLIYFSFTKICMFLYARIYWLLKLPLSKSFEIYTQDQVPINADQVTDPSKCINIKLSGRTQSFVGDSR
jgi:hypothetical protein